MTGTEIALVMASAATLVTAVGGLFIGVRKLKSIENQTDGMHKEVVREVRKAAELLAEVALATSEKRAVAAHDAGIQQGREETR